MSAAVIPNASVLIASAPAARARGTCRPSAPPPGSACCACSACGSARGCGARSSRRRSCGRNSSTTNRAIIGSETRSCRSRSTRPGSSRSRSCRRGRGPAPTNVRGTLRSRPNIAAGEGVDDEEGERRRLIVDPWIGVMRTPARAARKAPSAHDAIASRSGLPALSSSRSGSSTTARMATPVRVATNRNRRPMATSTAMTMAPISCHARFTPATVTVLSAPKNRGTAGACGRRVPDPRAEGEEPSITLTGTTMRATSDTLRRPRTHAVQRRPQQRRQHPQHHQQAMGAGQPQSHRTCQ